MLEVGRYLYFSRSIDLSHEEERYFNLSMVGRANLFACLNANRTHRNGLNEGRTDFFRDRRQEDRGHSCIFR